MNIIKGIVIALSFVILLNPSPAGAHRSGCHRWHSCPSDTGSYSCGDAGYACQYPTYPKSGGVVYPTNKYYKDCYDCPLKLVPTIDTRTWKKELQKGSYGTDVSNLQKALKVESLYFELINGVYDLNTENAVKKFQKKYNIVTSGSPNTTGYGRVGSATLSKLNSLHRF